MTEKIQGYQFAIDLDDGGMTRTMRELKNEAKLLKSGMQANFAEIRSGEGIMAAYAGKVNDAGRAVEAQRLVIERLKKEQDGLDQTTVKGREAYVKYENQINSAKRTISSLQAQQDRAKHGLELQKSGVLQLKDATQLSDKVTESYVGRLKAEGKEFEANKAKASGLRESYVALNKQLQAENNQLDKVANSSGKNSREYKEQQVRVNELGTKIARTKTQMKELDAQLSKKPHTGLNAVIGQLNKINEHGSKVDHLFGKIFGARMLANGVVSAWQSLTSHIGEAVEAGKEYDKEQQKMQATWTTLTGSTKDGKAMVDVTNKLSVALGQDVDVTDELNQQFYHVLDKKGPTETLTKSVLTMGDAVGLSSDNVKNLGLNFTHMMSSSKMQLGDFNHITDALPMYGHALLEYEQKVQKNSKLTMSELRKQMSAGKISAKDAENVMNSLGNKYKEASDNLMKTIPGMERVIKSRVPALLGDIEKPIMNAQNPIYGAVSKWVSDKRTEKEFTKVGTAANKGIATITKAFAKAFDVHSAPKAMDDVMNGLASGVTKASNSIAKNAPEITDFFKTVKNLGGVGFDTLIESLKLTNAILKPTLSLVGGHTATIAKFGAAWWVANKAIKGTSTVLSAFKRVSDGISWASKVFGIKSETTALKEQNEVLKTNAELSAADSGNVGTGYRKVKGRKATNVANVAEDLSSVTNETEEAESLAKSGTKVGTFAKMGNRLKSLKSLGGAGKALVGSTGILDVLMAGTDLIGTNSKNVGDHVGGAAGNLGGGALGGTIGTLIAPGIGTAIGAGIGSMGGDKVGRLLGKQIQKGLDANKPKVNVVKPKPVKLGVTTDEKKINTKLGGLTKKLSKSMVLKMSADPSSYAKTKSQTDKLFTQMRGSVDRYYKNKESKSKKDLDKLVKNGSMTQKEEDKILKNQRASDAKAAKSKKQTINKMQSDTSKYYSQVQKIENGGTKKLESIALKYGRNSKQYENEKNKELASAHKSYISKYTADEYKLNTTATKALRKGATQQKSILSQLVKDRGKLNKRDLTATQKNADKKYEAAVKPARKTRDQVISSAETQYKSTNKTASHEYNDLHSISKKQYEAIVSKAKKQRDDTDAAANDQYKKVTKHATAQHKSVSDEIEHQRKEVTKKQQDQQAASIAAATHQSKDVVLHQMRQANGSMKANHKQGTGLAGIWKGIAKFFNGLTKPFGIKALSAGDYSDGYTPMTMPAYATGGIVGATHALVGEGGVEAKVDKANGQISFVGMNGAEIVNVNPGDQILNATDTEKLFTGGIGRTLPGYAKGTLGITEFLKKAKNGAESLFENVSEKAEDALSKITNPIKTLKALTAKIFDPTKTADVGSVGHSLGKGIIDNTIKGVAKAISSLVKSVSDSGGSYDGAKGHYNPALIEKAAKEMHAWPLPAGFSKALQATIMSESGGKSVIQTIHDSNSGGNEAGGILQYTPGTFAAFAMPGHKNRMSPYDELLAFFNNSDWKNSIGWTTIWGQHKVDWLHSGPQGHRRFANGGFSSMEQLAHISEGNKLEAIVPMDLSKRSRAYQVMQQIMANFAPQDKPTDVASSKGSDSVVSASSNVEAQLDAVLDMMAKLLNLNASQITAIRAGAFDKNQLYKQQGYDQAMADAQNF
ncbi:tape measure protein [Lactiplantibacillus plantarum]|uniref:tape measure protein n=1 Tax=Lactiplantibacillus plantarum TaxID=1590 RepID=UPI004035EC9F